MQKKLLLGLILLVLGGLANNAVGNIDSLYKELRKSHDLEDRCYVYIQIGDYYELKIFDSAYLYYNNCLEIAKANDLKRYEAQSIANLGVLYHRSGDFVNAMEYYNQAVELRLDVEDYIGLVSTYNNIGIIHRNYGNYIDAMYVYEKALELVINENIEDGLALAYNNMAIVHIDQGAYDTAIEYLSGALEAERDAENYFGVARVYNNIGNVYMQQDSYNAALQFFTEGLQISYDIEDKQLSSVFLNNIGNVYSETKESEKALDYYIQSMEIKQEVRDMHGLSSNYNNIGNIHRDLGNYDEALENYQKSLEIDIELKDILGQSIVYNNISYLHILIADSVPGVDFQENINAAKYYGKKSIDIAEEIGAMPVKLNTTGYMIQAYKKSGDYKEALEYAESYIEVNKQLFDDEKTKALTEMQTKYETEKKQQEITTQQLVIEKQEIDNKRQRTQRNFFIAGSIFLTLLVGLVFKGYQDKKRSHNIITEKNAMLIEANEEIHAQKDEIEAQHNMVIMQKEQIEIQKTKIEDSIRYARRIQKAVLPKEMKAKGLIGEHFVIFKPKDVVSGDFYWATTVDEMLIIAVADCTGHGVPGAFMSMLGVSYLNEIVRRKEVNNPALVLDHLRASVIEALGQTISGDSQKDGMDVSLLAINTANNECMWAGAGLPLWIIKSDNNSNDPDEKISVIKHDKMTIAIGPKMENFKYHSIKLEKGDKLYLFSDGMVDQFGGPSGKKFMSKQLKQLIAENSGLPMSEQHDIIESTLNQWMRPGDDMNYSQIDDITMVGIAI